MKVTVTTIKRGVDETMAADLMHHKMSSLIIQDIEPLYFPYYLLTVGVNTRLLAHKISANLACMIDLVEGAEAMTTVAMELVEMELSESLMLPRDYDLEAARAKGLETVRHHLVQNTKVMNVPKVTVEEEQVVYKPFWVISCLGLKKETFSVLMDGVTGEYQLLHV